MEILSYILGNIWKTAFYYPKSSFLELIRLFAIRALCLLFTLLSSIEFWLVVLFLFNLSLYIVYIKGEDCWHLVDKSNKSKDFIPFGEMRSRSSITFEQQGGEKDMSSGCEVEHFLLYDHAQSKFTEDLQPSNNYKISINSYVKLVNALYNFQVSLLMYSKINILLFRVMWHFCTISQFHNQSCLWWSCKM